MTRLAAVLSLCALLALAGCTSGPFDLRSIQQRPVEIVLDNSANETQTFEVWVVEAGSNVTIHRNDSETYNSTIGQGHRSYSSGEYHYFTAVEPPDSARLHARVTLAPGEENRSSIENFSQYSAVVVVLRQGDTIGWWASAYCSDLHLTGVEVHSRPSQYGDAWAGSGCR